MNLGFLGVGNWAQKLATAFRECGAEIVAYDRGGEAEAPGFGTRSTVQAMIHGDICDALILCAPPEVTTVVALECAKAGKRCVATKPLMWTEYPAEVKRRWANPYDANPRLWVAHYLYVDLWRLYSPAWLAMKEELQGKKIERIDVAFCGNGPFRSFNGALDYGPHAMAFVFDLLGTTEANTLEVTEWQHQRPEAGIGALYRVALMFGLTEVSLLIGNGAEKPERSVHVLADGIDYRFDEPDGPQSPGGWTNVFTATKDQRATAAMVHTSKEYALRRFCRAFMAGESSRTLEYSIAAQRVLERIIDGS